jgi:uncharacterized membrane protein (UPF0127 family)
LRTAKRQGYALPFSFVPALFLLAALVPAAAFAQQNPVTEITAGMYRIRAEVVADHETRARGLMHRKSLPGNAGMLFIFDDHGIHCMWMKNTLIPLSVAFIDDRGAIVNIADMEPHSEASHCAARPVKYALEMNRGWFAARGIGPGARLGGVPPR